MNDLPVEVSFDAEVAKQLASQKEGRPVWPCRPPIPDDQRVDRLLGFTPPGDDQQSTAQKRQGAGHGTGVHLGYGDVDYRRCRALRPASRQRNPAASEAARNAFLIRLVFMLKNLRLQKRLGHETHLQQGDTYEHLSTNRSSVQSYSDLANSPNLPGKSVSSSDRSQEFAFRRNRRSWFATFPNNPIPGRSPGAGVEDKSSTWGGPQRLPDQLYSPILVVYHHRSVRRFFLLYRESSCTLGERSCTWNEEPLFG